MADEKSNAAKAYLQQVRLYDAHINNKLDELSQLKDMVYHITPILREDRVSGGGGQDRLGNTVAKIVDLEAEINRAVDAFIDKKREVSKTIEQIQNPDQVQVLHKRYFEYMTWEQIACDMHMTYRNVCYIHGRALQAVAEVIG